MLSMSDHGDEDSEAEESESEPEIEAGVKHSIPRQTGLRRLQWPLEGKKPKYMIFSALKPVSKLDL